MIFTLDYRTENDVTLAILLGMGTGDGGLLKAFKEGITLSIQFAISHEEFSLKTPVFETYCSACGLVVDFEDENPESRAFPK